MKHQRWWCTIVYRHGCPSCKVRQLRYGFRLNPVGYKLTRDKVWYDKRFTTAERLWILKETHDIQVVEE